MRRTADIHVASMQALIPPGQLKNELPMAEEVNATVVEGRESVTAILEGRDHRLLVVVGPCSIHDEAAALDYARRLRALNDEIRDQLLVIMRVYFEKPRSTIGWKGFINDPNLDGTFDMATGLSKARGLLLEINRLGIPTATEVLDPITPQYLADLIAWASLGARTTESQPHRQMASGLSMPIGFKNSTDGNLQNAIDAMSAARHRHHFLGIDQDGRTCIVETTGNPLGHLILRGGRSGSNYDPIHVAQAMEVLDRVGLPPRIMIDCNHANSGKRHQNQQIVWKSVLDQRAMGNTALVGLMLESNIEEGSQPLTADPSRLRHGVSITDACIGWPQTEVLLRHAHKVMAGQA